MKNSDEIWKTRINHHINETRSYLKYMLNDHLLFVFIFLAAGGAVAYQGWLETLSPSFPVALIMAVTFAVIMSASSVRTLVKEADVVFLIPMEHKLKGYFQKAFTYSYLSQSSILVVVLILFSPLYFKVMTEANGRDLLISLLLLFVVKLWNLRLSWRIGFFTDSTTKWCDFIVRFLLNLCSLFFIFSGKYILVLCIALVMLLYDAYFSKLIKAKAIKWDLLLKKENEKKQSFYKLANMFTDVPKLRKRAKRRKYLDWLLGKVKYNQENFFEYLFSRAFLRSGDYSGIVLRLTLIGAIIITFSGDQLIGNSLVVILFSFLTGIQIMSLYKHFELIELPQLYPKAEAKKLSSFLLIMYRVLLGQIIVYSIVTLLAANIVIFAVTLGIGIVFVSLFVFGYMGNRLKK